MIDKQDFLCRRSRYYGRVLPEHLIFNANLQEFAHRISFIANLQTAGKLSLEESYEQMKGLWKQLKRSKKQLGIDTQPFQEQM